MEISTLFILFGLLSCLLRSVLFCFNILLESRQELEVFGYMTWYLPKVTMTIKTVKGGLME